MPCSVPGRAFISALALAIVATAPAPAAAQEAAVAKPPVKWQIDWDAPYCKITTGDPKDVVLSIWTVPGSNSVEIYLIGASRRMPKIPSGANAVFALDDGTTISRPAFYPGPVWDGLLQLGLQDDQPLQTLSKARAISIQARGKQISLPVVGARTAMRALQECVEQQLPQWGIDPLALHALKKLPTKADEKPWLTVEDYPQEALRAEKGGVVVARITVDTSGQVSNCVVVQSSGISAMDRVTCKRAQERARFQPAIGPDGKSVETPYITYTSFKLFSYP